MELQFNRVDMLGRNILGIRCSESPQFRVETYNTMNLIMRKWEKGHHTIL